MGLFNKKFWGDVWGKTKQTAAKIGRAIPKIIPKAIEIGRNVLDKVEKVPGILGETAKTIKGGIGLASDIADSLIPEGKFKEGVKKWLGTGSSTVDRAKEWSDEKYDKYVKPVVDKGRDITNRVDSTYQKYGPGSPGLANLNNMPGMRM